MQKDQIEVGKSLSIQDVFKRQVDLKLSLDTGSSLPISLDGVNWGCFSEKEQNSTLDCEYTLKDLERLFFLKTEQIKKYSQALLSNSNFPQQHEMVLGLLCI